VRLVIARCRVDYTGRLTAHLPEATRLIMVKADGTLAIHNDGNASKPPELVERPLIKQRSVLRPRLYEDSRGRSTVIH
jgi:hypothetical protein